MGNSKVEALIDEPERFCRYFDDDDIRYISEGLDQSERIARLKERFEERLLGHPDKRGQDFVLGKDPDDDIRIDEDYSRALMRMYNCDEFQDKLQGYGEFHKMKQTKEIERIITTEKKPPEVTEKKIFQQVGGYYNKAGNWIAPYNRSIPDQFSKRELRWLTQRLKIKSSVELTKDFNAFFKQGRTTSSIGTKKLRLRKATEWTG